MDDGQSVHKLCFLSHLGYEPFNSLTRYSSADWQMVTRHVAKNLASSSTSTESVAMLKQVNLQLPTEICDCDISALCVTCYTFSLASWSRNLSPCVTLVLSLPPTTHFPTQSRNLRILLSTGTTPSESHNIVLLPPWTSWVCCNQTFLWRELDACCASGMPYFIKFARLGIFAIAQHKRYTE